MKLRDYPKLAKAFEYMLVDNVASQSTARTILHRVNEANLFDLDGAPDLGKFNRADAELKSLNEEDFFEVCCGEVESCQVSTELREVLAFLFEEIHE